MEITNTSDCFHSPTFLYTTVSRPSLLNCGTYFFIFYVLQLLNYELEIMQRDITLELMSIATALATAVEATKNGRGKRMIFHIRTRNSSRSDICLDFLIFSFFHT